MEQENKLGTMPIGRLLISMSIPMMVSFFIQALYNIVDSMFVAMVSEDALTAVSIAFPMQNIITAIGVGTGVAVSALVPRFLAQEKREDAEKITNITVFLSACYWIIFILVGLFVVRPYYILQTGEGEIAEEGIQYLTIVCTVSLGAFFGQIFAKLLVSTGHSVASMAAQATGAIFNIIFDPLLIFGLGPFPELGIVGAAVATVSGQIIGAIVAAILAVTRQKSVRIRFGAMKPDRRSLREIYAVGIPSIITVGLSSVMSFFLNQILLIFSTTATAVFGIWIKLQNFAFMPVFGMNNGTIPMISYNYGTGKIDRVNKTIRLALVISVALMAALAIVFELVPGGLLRLFSASDNMLDIGKIALRLTCLSLPFGAVTLIFSSSFQALQHNGFTLAINLCRQFFFIVPIAWLLSLTGRVEAVFASVVITEAMSAALSAILRRRVGRDLSNFASKSAEHQENQPNS